jgi:hypothetical protein
MNLLVVAVEISNYKRVNLELNKREDGIYDTTGHAIF